MTPKLLSHKNLNLWHKDNKIKLDHYEYGYEPEQEFYFPDKPYLKDGKVIARLYVDGIGFKMKHAIYVLEVL
jgi:hypothetical protein